MGAGILCLGCAPTVRHCVVRDNVAAKGAGMYNLATREWPADETRPAPVVVDCTFLRNHARARGGAVCNDLMTHATFVDCSFLDNRCDAKGGAMYNDFDCSPTLVSCLFAGNVAHKGGGMANDGRSSPVVTNCTFTRNHATAMYGALYSGTGPTNVPNAPVVTNCIFWSDTADAGPGEIGDWHDCLTAVTYSCVEGGHAGEGNVDADPRFVDPAHGDFRLGPGSPCVDSGHGGAAPPTDRDGNARFDDAGCPTGPFARVPYFPPGAHLPEPSMDAGFQAPVDMGAYERQERVRGSGRAARRLRQRGEQGRAVGRPELGHGLHRPAGGARRGVSRRRGGLGGRGHVPHRRGRRPPPLVPSAGRSRALRRLRRHGGAPRAARLEDQRDDAQRRSRQPAR